MAQSYNQYLGNGTNRNFIVPFKYLNKQHVKVSVDGVQTTAFTWINDTEIQLTTAPASGAFVDVRRITPSDNPVVDFVDGSILQEADLDLLARHSLFLAQEASDNAGASLSLSTAHSDLSARGLRIRDVGTPVGAADATRKDYVDARIPALNSTQIRQSSIATEGQTAIDIVIPYVPGANQLNIYINSVRQNANAYTETSSTRVTLSEGLTAGDEIEVVLIGSISQSIEHYSIGFSGIKEFADDAAAGAGGIAVGRLYRTGSVLKLRVA